MAVELKYRLYEILAETGKVPKLSSKILWRSKHDQINDQH